MFNQMPVGPNVLPGLDEYTVTFVDHTIKTVDLGAITLLELLNYITSGDKDAECVIKWPKYETDYDKLIFKICIPKPDIIFTIGRDGQDMNGWTVEFVG